MSKNSNDRQESMMLTSEGLTLAGFQPISADTRISARFHRLEVFKAEGFTLDDNCLLVRRSENVRGVTFDLALGNSLNGLCLELVQDEFAPDEAEWIKEHRTSPPFLVLHLGPTEMQHTSSGHQGRFEGRLVTYGAFTDVRSRLREDARRLAPQLVSAVISQFSRWPERIGLKSIYADTFGVTDSGEQLTDMTLEASARISVSRHRTALEVTEPLHDALRGADRITHRSADYFYLASKEDDDLKAFLFFFLAVEVQVHRTFESINRQKILDAQVIGPPALATASKQLFAQVADATELGERFIWCALGRWTTLTDSDVRDFFELKKLRNDIAHGRRDTVAAEHVTKARVLAAKVLASVSVATHATD